MPDMIDDEFDPMNMDPDKIENDQISSSAPEKESKDVEGISKPHDNSQDSSLVNSYDQDINRLLSQAINLNGDNIIHEPSCEICSSEYREELEAKWLDSNRSYTEVKKLLQSKGVTKKISKSTIQNHMLHHFDRSVTEIQKIEYLNRIRRYNNYNLTTLDRIKLGISALTDCLMGINSIVPDSETSAAEIQKIKSSETSRLMSSMSSLLKLQAEIMGEMKNSGELITIPKREFINVFNEAIISAKNDSQRDAIKDILSKLGSINRTS